MKNKLLNTISFRKHILAFIALTGMINAYGSQQIEGFLNFNANPTLKGLRLITDQSLDSEMAVGFSSKIDEANHYSLGIKTFNDSVSIASQFNASGRKELLNAENLLFALTSGTNLTRILEQGFVQSHVRGFVGLAFESKVKYLKDFLYSSTKGDLALGLHFNNNFVEALFKSQLHLNILGFQASLSDKTKFGVEVGATLEGTALTGALKNSSYLSFIPMQTIYGEGSISKEVFLRVESGLTQFNRDTQSFDGSNTTLNRFIKMGMKVNL